jgi:hypothetical protein
MTDARASNSTHHADATSALDIQDYRISDSTRLHNAEVIQVLTRAALKRKLQLEEYGVTPLVRDPVQQDGEEKVHLIELVSTLCARDDLAPSSMVTYRAAVRRYLLEHFNDPLFEQAMSRFQDYWLLMGMSDPLECPTRNHKPRKTRNFPLVDFTKLHDALLDAQVEQKSIWAARAIAWMDAGLVTGLRPIEWDTVQWTDATKTMLRATNGKIKTDVPGYLRREPISHARRQQFQNVEPTTRDIPVPANSRSTVTRHLAMIEHAQKAGIDFATYHKQASQVIRRACLKIWKGKKQYTLYSLRRQFAANAADQYGVEASSIMMGHSKPQNPAASVYGIASQAYSRVGKSRQEKAKNSEAQQSADVVAVKKPAAPCKYLAYRDAKQALEQEQHEAQQEEQGAQQTCEQRQC